MRIRLHRPWVASCLGVIACSASIRDARAQATEPLAFVQSELFPYSKGDLGPTVGQIKLEVLRVRVRWPLFFNDKRTLLLPGASFERLKFESFAPLAETGTSQRVTDRTLTLQSPMAELTLIHRVDARWTTIAMAAAGLASDFEGALTGDDWAVVARLIATYRLEGKLTVGGGVGYDRRTGDLSLIPLALVHWEPSERWHFNALLPKMALVSYRTATWLTTSLRGELDYNRFHIDEERYGVRHLYLRYVTVKVGPSLTISPNALLHFDLYGGYAFARNLSAFTDESPLGVDLYVNSPDPNRSIHLNAAAFFGFRFWVGLDGFSPVRSSARSSSTSGDLNLGYGSAWR